MRILLAHNSLYFPSHGGGDKSNRLLMEALADRGHTVRVVARVERFGPEEHDRLVADLRARDVEPVTTPEGVVSFTRLGVDIRVLALQPNLRAYFAQQIASFDPEVIITSTDDPAQLLFDLAARAPRARVVHLVRATIAVPFGPDSSAPNATKSELLKHADAVVGVSEYVAGYVRKWGGIDATHVPISLLESVIEYPNLGRFDNPYVSMVNPCAVKGIGIFLELAKRMPDVQFAAVPTWGTTPEDAAAMLTLPNVEVLPPVDNIDRLLEKTRVMLVPSVWAEARSRIVPEAMSRGVPVVSSNAGGIPEAHLGVPYMLPVRIIEHYRPSVDLNMVPVAEVPPQDVGPWEQVLRRLVTDRHHWTDIARQSREAAISYARNLNVLPFERLLHSLLYRPKKAPPHAALSDDKRRLLALRLRQRAAATAKPAIDPWFAGIENVSEHQPVLFCFPYAGGGTMTYSAWRDALKDVAGVVPVRLPGRETRLEESPLDSMDGLLDRLVPAIQPHTRNRPFAFFGHSMGAGIAFEVARRLGREPSALIVSAARGPSYRANLPEIPDPSDAELIEQLRRLQGIPREVLESEELLNIVLPALRADTRLYRNYRYQARSPLQCAVFAYGGTDDPNVAPEHLDAWRAETEGVFLRRVFPGGHFYLQAEASGVLEAIRQDLAAARLR